MKMGSKGYDTGKQINGRKQNILTESVLVKGHGHRSGKTNPLTRA